MCGSNLNNNVITALGNNSFLGLSALYYLYVKLSVMPSLRGYMLESHTCRYLSNNEIAAVDIGAFNGLVMAFYLYVRTRGLCSVPMLAAGIWMAMRSSRFMQGRSTTSGCSFRCVSVLGLVIASHTQGPP